MRKATKKKENLKLSDKTKSIHGQFSSRAWEFSHHLVPPLTASTTFRLKSLERGAKGFSYFANQEESEKQPIWIYDRLEEPTTKMLEEQLVEMEKGECAISFGSGMGAISSTLLALTSSGQKIIAHRTLYGCSYSLITTWMQGLGISNSMIDVNNLEILKAELTDPKARVIYFESVSNPILEIVDIPAIVKLVKEVNRKRSKENKVYIVVDNTFATPWSMRPLTLGVDFVIQSLTKNIAGFGTEMGGAVITRSEFESKLLLARKDFGAIMHPYSAWHILVYGIPTQSLRFETQQANAIKIAQFLEKHPKVKKVVYPGLKSHPQYKLAQKLLISPEKKFSPGTMLSFQVKGGMKQCQKFVDDIAKNAHTITLAVSLGLIKTLIEVPGFMTHSAIPKEKQSTSGIDPTAIRLSVGLEDVDDIINELSVALSKI